MPVCQTHGCNVEAQVLCTGEMQGQGGFRKLPCLHKSKHLICGGRDWDWGP